MPAGRPRKYKSPKKMLELGEAYLQDCRDRELVPTMTELALELGFVDRQSLYDYAERPEFSCAIKRLMGRIAALHERALAGTTVTGHIFWLKNHGWRDVKETDNTHHIDLSGASDEDLLRIIAGED